MLCTPLKKVKFNEKKVYESSKFFPFLLMTTDGTGPYSSQDQILLIIIGVS